MKKNNNEKTTISTIFTEKELAELNFTEEEIETIEQAQMLIKMADTLPSDEKAIDALMDKIDATFTGNLEETILKLKELSEKDPAFLNQIMVLGELFDEVEQVPPPKAEKVSLADISKVNAENAADEKKAKYNAILEAIKHMNDNK